MPYVAGGGPQADAGSPEVLDVFHSGNVYANFVPIALWQDPQGTEAAILSAISLPSYVKETEPEPVVEPVKTAASQEEAEETKPAPAAEEEKIGGFVASLIEDKSTLQMGIGSIPNAALSKLIHHKDLGLHTEMFSDGVIDLILKDVINGNYKGVNPGRALATFFMGTKRLYDYVDDNPFIELRSCDYVNDVSVIKQNDKMVAINSAIEVDVTGQVCADSIGSKMYSGVGGQIDFIRGASLSEGGKAIIALPSITNKGISRIVPSLKPGAGVVTTRSHVHYVITEYGVANLYGKTIKQRVKALVNIAHPDYRESIDRQYFDLI